MSSRVIAIEIIKEVIEKNMSLKIVIDNNKAIKNIGKDEALIKEISFGTLRWYTQLEYILTQLVDKPIKKKQAGIIYIIHQILIHVHFILLNFNKKKQGIFTIHIIQLFIKK